MSADPGDPSRPKVWGIVVVVIGALQILAGILVGDGIFELVVSGAGLVGVGLAVAVARSRRVTFGGAVFLAAQLAVFFVMMLRAPRAIPRLLILGIIASLIMLVMSYRSAERPASEA